jgi:pimeloyl-ACP methyl ester carboxylesterase
MLLLPGTATPAAALEPLAALLGAKVGTHSVEENRRLLGEDGAVFGWSSGAFAALHLAAVEPRVTSLALYEPPYLANQDDAPGQAAIFMKLMLWELLGQRRRALRAFWELVSARADGTRGVERLSAAQLATLGAWNGPLLQPVLNSTGKGTPLPSVRTRLGLGTASAGPMKLAVERLHRALPNASVEVVPEVDHLGPFRDPQRFAAWLR